MAESSSSSPFWIDDFVKFSKIIALELESKDIEELKFSIQDRIPKSRIAEIETGIQLISLLKEYRLLSENNLDYFIELLAESRRIDLTNKVIEYRNNLDVVRNAPQAEMEERLPAPNMELLYLVIPGQNKTVTIDKIEHIKQSICVALDIKISEVFYITASHCDPGCTRLMFQIPSRKDILQQLQWDALNKEPWMTNLNVIELKVGMRAVIPLGERQVQEKTSAHGVDSALEIDKTVPPEILARGSEALKAYNKALENGKIKNQRVLVTVVGPARAGKTSLLRTLKGEKYNPAEDSTVGVQLQQAFCKPKENSWCEKDGNKDFSYKKYMAKTIAENLNAQTIVEEPIAERAVTNDQSQLPKSGESQQHYDTGASQQHPEDTVQQQNEESTSENKTKQKPEKALKISEIPKEIIDEFIICKNPKLTNAERTDENDIFLKTLDFAGQSVYNVIHPLFMSPKAIYILVHSLKNNLLAQMQSKVKHCSSERELDNPFQMTNLDTLEFWLSCISFYANLHGDFAEKLVYVVCTHADLCMQNSKQVARKVCKSLTRPENPSGKHVIPNIYTVDNTLSGNKKVNDESAKKLKADIEEKAKSLPQMNEDIPLTWLWFEDELSKLVQKEQNCIDLEEAKGIATKCKVNTESNEFTTLLNYLHDLKTIIYFQETRIVFINTQWLVNMFVKVITVMPFEEWKDYADSWRKLEDEGVLQRDLVEHVWKDIVADRKSTVDSMLLIMEKFSLICSWKLNGQDVNLVPSMVCKSKTREEIDVMLLDQKSSTIAVCFNSVHLPLGIFPRLFFAIAEFCKKEWPVKEGVQLFQNFCRMYNVGKEGRFDLCIASDIRTIYVTVYNSGKVDGKLVTVFCQSVRELLDHIFEDMRHKFPWMKNMKFEYGIRCPICTIPSNECETHKTKRCIKDSCLHFVKEESLNKDRPRCCKAVTTPDNFIKEGAYSHWFPKEHVSQDEYNWQ